MRLGRSICKTCVQTKWLVSVSDIAGDDMSLPTDSPAYFPLLIKSLLRTPLQNAPDTEIVSDGLMRYSYRDFEGRLKTARTCAVFIWDRAG